MLPGRISLAYLTIKLRSIFLLSSAGFAFLLPQPAQALILYNKDNSQNLNDPNTGVPFDAVARLGNSGGGIGGTGVHLGNGYILTANHVTSFDTVTFDGTTFFTQDGAAAVQVATGVDMKIFHLSSAPPVSAALIYTGSDELLYPATIVGWGLGRDPASSLGSGTVAWGSGSTIAKRWGTNTPKAAIDDFSAAGYTYDALETVLGNIDDSEAAVTLYDSGSGLFQEIDDIWYLTGITTTTTTKAGGSTSTFGDDYAAVITPGSPSRITFSSGSGDINLFVRTSSYATLIAVPEPSYALLALLGLPFFFRRGR